MPSDLLSATKRGFAWAVEFYYVLFVAFPFLIGGAKLLGWLQDVNEEWAARAEAVLDPVADLVFSPIDEYPQ